MTQEKRDNRKNRRATAAQQRRHPQPANGVPVDTRLAELGRVHNQLADALKQNAGIMQHAFGLQDRHIAVQYRVSNDVHNDMRERCELAVSPSHLPALRTYLDSEGDIDLNRYHLEYAVVLVVTQLLEALNTAVEAEKAALVPVVQDTAPHGLVPMPDFGGANAESP